MCIFSLFSNAFISIVFARTPGEVGDEIEQQEDQLEKVKGNLSAAEKELELLRAGALNAKGAIPQLEAQIKELEATIDYNVLKLKYLKDTKVLKKLEEEANKYAQQSMLRDAYTTWRTDSSLRTYMTKQDRIHTLKRDFYRSQLIANGEKDIYQLAEELAQISFETLNYEEEMRQLEAKIKELQIKKVELQAQIDAMNKVSAKVAGLRTQSVQIQQKIAQLTKEQADLEKAEDDAMEDQPGNGGGQDVPAGQFYFGGTGRDLYQGHGVGLSQFGAMGAAQKGWSAEQILNFYYAQTQIQVRPGNVVIQGGPTLTADQYVAGLGEVPDKACGTAAQVVENPAKYVVDNTSTIWDCWPAEAIKAQVIAARSYALSYGGPICTTASCQVYKGGTAKQWAADETSNMVVVSVGSTHNNQIIQALYSSDNNQGYGTAHNDTVFSGLSGNGTPYSYLRAANDSTIVYKYKNCAGNTVNCADWQWRTDGFPINRLDNLLTYASTSGNVPASTRTYVAGLKAAIGNVANLEFVRDPSKRVKQVIFVGTNGARKELGGWAFKAIWNSWVANEKPNGSVDYIYSLTFFLNQNQ